MAKNAKVNANAVAFAQVEGNAKRVMATRDGENAIYLANALKRANEPIYEALDGVFVNVDDKFFVDFPSEKNAKKFVKTAIRVLSAEEYASTRKTDPKAKVEKKATVPATAKGKKTKTEPKKALSDYTNEELEAEMNKRKSAKVEPKKAKGSTKKADKGFRFERVTDKKGNTKLVDTRADEPTKKATAKKAKGNTKPTTAPNAKVNKSTKAKTETKKATPKKTKGNVALTDAQKKALDIAKMSILNRAASAYSIANGGEAINFKDLGKSEKDLAKFIPKAKAGMLKSNKWAKAVKMGITEDMLGF
jgi:hypothetical protein